jgi:hypothetical protein
MGKGKDRNQPCPCGSGLKYKKCCYGKPSVNKEGNMSQADKELIATIMDTVMDEYLADHKVVFRSNSDRALAHFSLLKAQRKDFERSRICMFPDCTRRSIKRSHTISRGALSLIAEDGHVFSPEFNQVSGHLGLAKIGLNQASTFPGFCELHELEFQRFESIVQMRENNDYVLQLFRTICREIAIKEHHLRHLKTIVQNFKKRRTEWGQRRTEELLRAQFQVDVKFSVKGFQIETDDIVAEADRKLDETGKDLPFFKESFFKPFLDAQQSGVLELTLVYDVLPERLPLALAGRGEFIVRANEAGSNGNNIQAILNVLPTKDGTAIFICVPNAHKEDLMVYISSFRGKHGDREGVLRMIESWMLHGSDHWFLSPSAWLGLSGDQRETALKAIMDTSHNIGAEPEAGLLDGARNNPQPVRKQEDCMLGGQA